MVYKFIVDSDRYTGGFERQMCAYVTGVIGDCEVGIEESIEYLKNHLPVSGVMQVEDENECSRPVAICTTPGVWNNGLGYHFKDGEEKKAIEEYKKYSKKQYEGYIARVEEHRGKGINGWDDKTIDREINDYRKQLSSAKAKDTVDKYPAYESLCIYFKSKPSTEALEFMKKRVYEYAEREGIHIKGFREEY